MVLAAVLPPAMLIALTSFVSRFRPCKIKLLAANPNLIRNPLIKVYDSNFAVKSFEEIMAEKKVPPIKSLSQAHLSVALTLTSTTSVPQWYRRGPDSGLNCRPGPTCLLNPD